MQRTSSLSVIGSRLKSRHVEDRLSAIRALDRLEGPEVDALLLDAMRDRLSYVGAVAARVLASRVTPEIVESMIEHFTWASEDGPERDAGCAVRTEIAVAIRSDAPPTAEDMLRVGIRTVQVEMVGMGPEDTAVGLRANCAIALAALRPRGAVIDLALLLFDAGARADIGPDTANVRRAAARGLGVLGDPAGSVALALRLADAEEPDADVLVECMDSLVTLEEPRAVELIRPFLESGNGYLVAGAAMALGKTRDAAVLPLLLGALDRASAELAAAVATAVATLRRPEARDALLERTNQPRSFLRLAAATALGVFPDATTRECLGRLAKTDPDRRVREAALRSLA